MLSLDNKSSFTYIATMIQLLNQSPSLSKASAEQAEKGLQALLQRTDLGFLQTLERPQLLGSTVERAKQIQSRFEKTVVVGIGGSVLPGEVLAGLGAKKTVEFISNIDSGDFWHRMQGWDLAKTHFVLVSKSGTTVETLALAEFIAEALQQKGLSLHLQSTVICENKNSPLMNWAAQHQVLHLDVPLDVGGRVSAFTAVGFLPAILSGVDPQQILNGVRKAFEDTTFTKQMIAMTLDSFQRKERITSFWFYSARLEKFGLWLEQLWSESLGKAQTRDGKPAPFVSSPQICCGTTDQHSLLQQLTEGPRDTWAVLFRFADAEDTAKPLKKLHVQTELSLQGMSLGQVMALEAEAMTRSLDQSKVSHAAFACGPWGAETAGFLLMSFQLAIGGLGEALNINAFNQPGVELIKKLAIEAFADEERI